MALPAQKPGAPAAQRPAQPGARPAAAVQGPQPRRLKKGEILFAEGENSRAMYLLKSGMIRLYKKKGDANIELATVHAGEVIGELAFLDGNPRSASAEALTECNMVEISGPTFQAVLAGMPDWLKILLKAVVGRLRTASTRIRQLETASTAYDTDKDGKRAAHYIYLSPLDVLKIASAILLVGSRNGIQGGSGIEVRVGLLQRYGNQVMGVPVAKITTLIDVLAQVGVMSLSDEDMAAKVTLRDADFLEQMIAYLNEENLLEPAKRHDITLKGFMIMSMIAKHLPKYKKDETTGMTAVNIAEIKKAELTAAGKEPFRMDEFVELVKLGYCTNLEAKSADLMLTKVKAESFMQAFRLQKVVTALNAVNAQKAKGGNTVGSK